MKLVNEKGKLFGIINVVDLIILLAIVLVVGAVAYKFVAPSAGAIIDPKSDVYVTMRVRGAMDYLNREVTKLEPGAKLVAGSNYIDATLVSVESVPYLASATTSDGQYRTAADPQKTDLLITIKGTASKNDAVLKLGTQEVRIGRGFVFKTQTVELNAIVETVRFDG